MANKKTILSEEIELSEIVLKKTNQAFEMIKQEDIVCMKKTHTRSKKMFKTQAAVIAGVCILAVSSISAVAAIHHYWGRGMNGNIQASDEQQRVLTEKNIAKVYSEEPDRPSLAVTNNGVTIEPDTVIVDERFVYMAFRISGYSVADRMEPGFDMVNVYQGDNPEDESAWVNMNGTMYDGIILDENGKPVYEDGTSIESYEDGSIISHYTDDNGNMEYMIRASVVDKNDSFLGKTMHVEFKNLGTFSKGSFIPAVDGNWNFEINLSDVSSTQNIKVGQKVEGTGFTMEDINVSPISIKVNYSVSAAPVEKEDDLGIPEVKGVVLKDGTRIPYLTNPGRLGYTDSSKSNAYQIAGFARVLDIDEMAALIVLTSYENEKVETLEIPVSK
ncbi:DUF4179 domain-containing protein [uncultured Phocaeicola sp.]|uniref:DUF4179 domain-containing protein n=1 Tax=uncultured Phocaeicola sp. TaxID=990718 RepID=UPI0026209198|nr:DUF4179 domain-containing protein [uncultured Phocaeicola sp.]